MENELAFLLFVFKFNVTFSLKDYLIPCHGFCDSCDFVKRRKVGNIYHILEYVTIFYILWMYQHKMGLCGSLLLTVLINIVDNNITLFFTYLFLKIHIQVLFSDLCFLCDLQMVTRMWWGLAVWLSGEALAYNVQGPGLHL
jgi:hypothetical protein